MAVFPSGHILTSNDFDLLFPTGIGAWSTYTPTWTQGATVTKNVVQANYMRIGRLVVCMVHLNATGAGTANNTVLVSLPVAATAAAAASFGSIGAGYLQDASVATVYASTVALASTTTVYLRTSTSTANVGQTGGVFTVAIAAGDNVSFMVTYEGAS